MSPAARLRGLVTFLFVTIASVLACSLGSTPATSPPPTFDPTKAALEFQATSLAAQLTQAASSANLQPTPAPTLQVELQPTLPAPPPTEPSPAEPPQQRFFTEEFNAGVTSWSTFLTSGDQAKLKQSVENGFWVFDLGARQMYVYSLYQPEVYEDIRVDVRAENRGDNTNNISIICRYDEDAGWFEFNMYNSGLYNIYYGRWKSSGTQATYLLIADGGSNAIHQGKAVNDYTVICKGNTLSLFINGDEVQTITQNMYMLREGQVGVGVSSFDRLPVRVGFDSVEIREP